MLIRDMGEAETFLKKFVQVANDSADPEFRFHRAKKLMSLLGNPQNKIKVIHVAGTAGKGSTCHYLSSILQGQGFSVGLTISPHIIALLERIQVNNKIITESDFCSYLSFLAPIINKMESTNFGLPSFFEVMMAAAYFIFAEKKVDYAVIETGMGGRFDASNTVIAKNKVAVITKIGFDHTEFLGNTLKKIASEKAAIIQKGNSIISSQQSKSALVEIEKTARLKKAKLFLAKTPRKIFIDGKKIEFNFNYQKLNLEKIRLATPAKYQAENSALALTTIYELSKRDGFRLDLDRLKQSLSITIIPGRFAVHKFGKKMVIIDGAHNQSKMSAFVKSLSAVYPGKKLPFLISIKKEKNITEIVRQIIPVASEIIVTEFKADDQGWPLQPESAEQIIKKFSALNFHKCIKIQEVRQAWEKFLATNSEIVVVTGSLYLVSQILKENS